MNKFEKTERVVRIVRDIVIIIGILGFLYWWFFVPVEYEGDYYYEYPEEENISVDV